MEHFSVEGNINSIVQIFPVPVVSLIILGQSLTLDKFTWNTLTRSDYKLDCQYYSVNFWQALSS